MGIKDGGGNVTFGRMRSNSNNSSGNQPTPGDTKTKYFPAETANGTAQERQQNNHNSPGVVGYFSATSQAEQEAEDIRSRELQAALLRQVHNRTDLTKAERMMQKAGIKAGFIFDKDGNLVF